MTSKTITYNLFSPDQYDSYTDVDISELKARISASLTNVNIKKAMRLSFGQFSFNNITNQKTQKYIIDIQSGWDAILIGHLLTRGDLSQYGNAPSGYTKINKLFESLGTIPDEFVAQFADSLAEWFPNVDTIDNNKVTNPITSRKITVGGATYKNIFKSIKLQHITYPKLQVFNTSDYEIESYCVISYLKKKLLKRDYKIIKEELEKIKTPTYPELTTMLNSIHIGLDVYIIDGEQLQNQDYDKKIRIVIHELHMYVLKGNTTYVGVKTNTLSSEEFEQIIYDNDVSHYNDNSVIVDKVKYNRDVEFADVMGHYKFDSTFGINNIEFYQECNIRPVRYYNHNYKYVSGVDINSCYPNIINNDKYVFARQTGNEVTEKYTNGPIRKYGFYLCKFNNPSDIELVLFGKKSWILGDVILRLKLQKRIKIFYQHESCDISNGTSSEFDKIILTKYTGILSKYTTTNTTKYNTSSVKEQDALLIKYQKDAYYSPQSDCVENKHIMSKENGIEVLREKFKHKSGIYAYLSIIQYTKYQLYQIHEEIMKLHPDANIVKCYTDCIHYDVKITEKDAVHINSKLKGYSVKPEVSTYSFTNVKQKQHVPVLVTEKTNYDLSDVIDLLKQDKSFCMNAPGGYGKSYTIDNVIKKYLDENNMKYITSSSTLKSSELIDGVCINTIIANKDVSFNNLIEYFKDIDYLIIDESSQLTMHLLTTIAHIKKHTKLKIILSGDANQCCAVDAISSWNESYTFNTLIDWNYITIKWSKYCRYTKEYDKFLSKLLKLKGRHDKLIPHVQSYFKNQINTEPTKLKIVWSHKKRIELLTLEYGQDYTPSHELEGPRTVHKWQGETITEPHTIYETERMPFNVLYTALTRTVDPKLITLII